MPAPLRTIPLDWVRQGDHSALVHAAVETRLRTRRRKRIRKASGLACLLLLGVASYFTVTTVRHTSTVETIAAHRQSATLSDGSTVDLNAQTALHTDFRFGRRHVKLDRGEAYFSVAKDPAHPFLVETPGGTVQVTGTKFNVRIHDDRRAEITLLEGSVNINASETAAPSVHLAPGEQFDSERTALRTLTRDQLDNVVSWRTGNIALEGLTLAEGAQRFAAYHQQEIRVSGPIGRLRLGGTCALDDLPGFLQFLEQAFPVKVVARPDGAYEIVGK